MYRGGAWLDGAGRGVAGLGWTRHVKARFLNRGSARHVGARLGPARHGKEMQNEGDMKCTNV